ncbi:hypothetical protein [Paracoccus aerodenitrificans]|uniref:hypothetical protein n=1 Tax=Paracoccus aerodenitrificans TaxID=3017781 RepID=UPI0022F144FA|nr:hypothetical protein [Paracoccus aerodenitrificans]WBU64011.1 hypothetical protein PAE61_17040 [Paracoccus aerodenitrificans]
MLRRVLIALALPLFLAACGADNKWASDEAVRTARYVSEEQPSISLMTVIGLNRGEGGHSALLINGSQRVIFDPAGSFVHPRAPERHDVLYGITPAMRNVYIDYHARDLPGERYYVTVDTVPVSRETADIAIRAAEGNGPVNKAFCAVGTSKVLSATPGFQGAPGGFSPIRLRSWFLTLPGVRTEEYRDNDPRLVHGDLLKMNDGSLHAYDR